MLPIINKLNETTVKDNYLDQNSLSAVKAMGRNNNPQALKEIAKKFEGMFVQQMLKSMREANAVFDEGDMFSSDEVKFHQDMLDQQMVINLTSGKGIGLATSMYQQMQALYGKKNAADVIENKTIENKTNENKINSNKIIETKAAENKMPVAQTPEEFIAALKPFAEKAAAELKINPDVLLAQAALETGWGKHVIHDPQGNNSFNIFNIKKNAAWEGKSVAVQSVEFKQGVAQIETANFRQYDNYLHSFSDYVALMKTNSRYQPALNAGNNSAEYAKALQQAGYATDPRYAEKIKNVLASDAIRAATVNRG
jgi:peptidoglycan hydrolase FlgJ